jgi:hypothetical protein
MSRWICWSMEKALSSAKACNRICEANQLKSVTLGAGKRPFDCNLKPEPDIRNLFRRGRRRNLSRSCR